MTLNEKSPTVYPTLRYPDASAALEFLTGTLGLTAGQVYRDGDGTIAHAELGWGNGIIMIGSWREGADAFDSGRAVLYLATADPDGLHARVVAAGADVVHGPTDQDYGSREFAVRDPEGNVWSFGTYQPDPIDAPTGT
ncbi:MAG TPA: VOC family protein [Pseudonocardia sp.]|jgi:uncharacterized glyoxalase superfamily protein PhnB